MSDTAARIIVAALGVLALALAVAFLSCLLAMDENDLGRPWSAWRWFAFAVAMFLGGAWAWRAF